MRTVDREAMCEGKRRYVSEKEAKAVRNYRQKQGATKHLRAYLCPVCHHWHLSSQKKREGKRPRKKPRYEKRPTFLD